MQRQNFRNISNNFVQGGMIQPGLHQNSGPQIRPNHNMTAIMQVPQAPVPPKIEPVIATSVALLPSSSQASHSQNASAEQSEFPTKYDITSRSMSESDLIRLKKINFKKKVSGKEKRVRQNRKLFRMLTPRNAIAALNELHGQGIAESTVAPTVDNQFEAEIVINNVRHVGLGKTKMQAKNAASEKALRDLVINKFQQMKNQEISNQPAGSEQIEDDKTYEDVPMMQLASYALHKLFAEWEAEGFEIPMPRVNCDNVTQAVASTNTSEPPQNAPKTPKAPKIRTELPPNSEGMHPVMLLSIMRPCTQYSDLGSQGVTPNIMHTVGATVDGQSFIGQGRSKKEARKRVATDILIKLFEWKGSCC